jgi:rhamnulokinase
MAVDIGASSGRCILGWRENGKIHLEEVHRFLNGPTEINRTMVWNVDRLFAEIVEGVRKAGEMGKRPDSLGVDTWGVDYLLLDKDGKEIGDAVCYRDHRTDGMDREVEKHIPATELYARAGTQFILFNTIYQLQALKLQHPEQLDAAQTLLFMPEYLSYRLTGKMMNEYTIASTSGLLNAASCDWDRDVIERLGLPQRIFGTVHQPGTTLGTLRPEVRDQVGYDLAVMLPACHDTASAVLAMPATGDAGDDAIYISSGTWSLMGIERLEPDTRDICRQRGFTNEGGYDRRYRFLRNIMGLWMIQSLRRELFPDHGFGELSDMARTALSYPARIDVTDHEFMAPESMRQAIVRHCVRNGGPEPASDLEVLACTYNSLADSYAATAKEIENLAGRAYSRISLFGGGCRDRLLNELTAKATGKEVYAGPVEATAIGNILSQMLARGEFADLAAARRAVAESFEVEKVRL